MQQSLLKTIRATMITRIEFLDTASYLTDEECDSLDKVAERVGAELSLRRAGLGQEEIRQLEFLKWRIGC
jgi:hypothetical protein